MADRCTGRASPRTVDEKIAWAVEGDKGDGPSWDVGPLSGRPALASSRRF